MAFTEGTQVRIKATGVHGFVVAVDPKANRYQFARTYKGIGQSWHDEGELDKVTPRPMRFTF